MNTLKIKYELPTILPHGWKKEVAKELKIHKNTITNSLKAKKGINYVKIIEKAMQLYGNQIK